MRAAAATPSWSIRLPAKLAMIASALMPEAVALAMDGATRAACPGRLAIRQSAHSGWQSLSEQAADPHPTDGAGGARRTTSSGLARSPCCSGEVSAVRDR